MACVWIRHHLCWCGPGFRIHSWVLTSCLKPSSMAQRSLRLGPGAGQEDLQALFDSAGFQYLAHGQRFLSPWTTPQVQKPHFQLPDFTKQWKLYRAVYRSLCRIPILSTNIISCKLWQQTGFYLRERLGGIATPKSAVFLSPTNRLSDNIQILGIFFWKRPGLGFLFGSRTGCVSGRACLPSAWGVCLESILGVNYHLGREDLGISASRVGTLHHQRGFSFCSNPDLSNQILPSVSTLDSGSGYWF